MRRLLFLFLILGIRSSAANGQSSGSLQHALVFRPGQEVLSGRIVDVKDDHLVLLTNRSEEVVPFSEVSRIIVRTTASSGRGVLYGAVLGGYVGMLAFGTEQNSGGYLSSGSSRVFGFLVGVLPSLALGAGLGYLIDSGPSEKEELIEFTGSTDSRRNAIARLRSGLGRTDSHQRIHVSFQGSQVNPSIPPLELPSQYHSSAYDGYTNFNILRRLQATYSIVPEVELGAGIVWFGQPEKMGSGYENLSNNQSRSWYSRQKFEANGKYVMVSYKPFVSVLDRQFSINVGGGLGIASVDYLRDITISTYDYTSTSGQSAPQYSSFAVVDGFPSGYLYGELQFNLDEHLSLALMADKVFTPSKESPPVPEAQIPQQALAFGNSSFGFSIGLHF
ncbi:MAG: hypothetical protein HY966_01450 [Ignavibacteriales bacterium]|nr:hypothetical protein [Ignavibacteriales bacterium]